LIDHVPPVPKTVLKGLSLEELRDFAQSLGERPFRGDQLFSWIYNKGAAVFSGMSNIPRDVRSHLEERSRLDAMRIA
jgi:23S rRNA (adenine2503-C2)-methyltransferase